MRKKKRLFVAYVFIFLGLTSCALHHDLVQPSNSIYPESTTTGAHNLVFECSASDIVSANSLTLSRKLEKNKLIFIPVKVTNSSAAPVKLSDVGFELINDYMPAQIIPQAVYLKVMRQKLWPNLLLVPAAILASFSNKEAVMDDGSITINHSYRINVLSGAISAWAILNSARTVFENKRAEKFFVSNDLLSMDVPQHSTVYGLVCIKGESVNEPMIRIKTTKP